MTAHAALWVLTASPRGATLATSLRTPAHAERHAVAAPAAAARGVEHARDAGRLHDLLRRAATELTPLSAGPPRPSTRPHHHHHRRRPRGLLASVDANAHPSPRGGRERGLGRVADVGWRARARGPGGGA
eukprot:scaffold3111_cov332-Prasinococcus_capsulatus_cf.AAC.11